MNEIYQITSNLQEVSKQMASVLIITGNLLTFKITSMRKLRIFDRLKMSAFRYNTSANY